jgi:HEAT repeat protein
MNALEKVEARERLPQFADKIATGEMLDKLRAIYAIGELKGQAIIDLLVGAAADESEDVRSGAIRALGDMGDTRVLKALVEALKDESVMVVRNAVEALGKYNDLRLLAPLMGMLKNKDVGVLEMALTAISRYGDKRSETAMLFFAAKGNKALKSTAIRALGSMDA